MELDPQVCYRALRTRDARFDGRFFTAVRTTRIFCRPICPAPTPKREHCTFVASAAAALAGGYRPCLRCRPEVAPGLPAWRGAASSVTRALRLISEGALDDGDAPALAARLGVTDRHLRRLFDRHLGASPVAVAQTRRLLLAKQLLDDTQLPIADVAAASGYTSPRRLHEALQRTYGRSPRALRRERGGDGEGGLRVRLSARPPHPWSAVLGYLGARAIPGVEAVRDGVWVRTFELEGARGVVEVRAAGSGGLEARIRLSRLSALGAVVARLRRVFDLDADPAAIAEGLAGDPVLARALAATPGLRVPGAFDPFELAVRAMLGQQVSVAAANTLAGRLVASHGEKLLAEPAADDRVPCRLFPRPEALARADLRALGLPGERARAISSLAERVARDPAYFDRLGDLDDAVATLQALPGIGPWTAHYVALRGLHMPDAFPAGDLGLRRALRSRDGELPSAAALARRAEAWRPWRGYGAVALWTTPTVLSPDSASAPRRRRSP